MDLSALESIAKALEESLDFWGLMLLLATALVVLGLVLEYWHDVQEFWTRLTWPMTAFPWDKFAALAGGILVTIGVAGELLVTYKASRVETQLRENSHKIEVLLTQEAGDAATSARAAREDASKAKSEADAVEAKAALLTTRLEAARAQLSQLEINVDNQGPRWRLIDRDAPEITAQLSPFEGQRVRLFICGTRESATDEAVSTAEALGGLFGNRWKLEDVISASFWGDCESKMSGFRGFNVYVSLSASKNVRAAASALGSALKKTFGLPPSSGVQPVVLEPTLSVSEEEVKLSGGFTPDKGRPTWFVRRDPELIVVLIGAHPQR